MSIIIQSIGTTSARSGNMREKIISILEAIDTFNQNRTDSWAGNENLQAEFTLFAVSRNILSINNHNQASMAKFARQKTSMLKQIGLIDDERNLTSMGMRMIGSTPASIPLVTPQQEALIIGLLNFEKHNNRFCVELFNYLLINESISFTEFKNRMTLTDYTDEYINLAINSINSFDDFNNYLPHRKSMSYNRRLYNVLNSNGNNRVLWESMASNSKIFKFLKKIVFGNSDSRQINFEDNIDISRENLIRSIFKAKRESLISEYFDQNKRILLATGIFHVQDERIHISPIFANFFRGYTFERRNYIELSDLTHELPEFSFQESMNITESQVFSHIISERNANFERWLNEFLSPNVLADLLEDISEGIFINVINFFNDNDIVNNIAAEYLIGIAYHYLNNREANFLESWNGTANDIFSPIMRAPGRSPDFNFNFEDRILLVEPTISTGMAQTNMEITQASRHLHDVSHGNKSAIIVAPNIFSETLRQCTIQRNSNIMIFAREISEIVQDLRGLNV